MTNIDHFMSQKQIVDSKCIKDLCDMIDNGLINNNVLLCPMNL